MNREDPMTWNLNPQTDVQTLCRYSAEEWLEISCSSDGELSAMALSNHNARRAIDVLLGK